MDRIKTAGGIVFKDGKFLFIYKQGMWDLPPMNVLYTFLIILKQFPVYRQLMDRQAVPA